MRNAPNQADPNNDHQTGIPDADIVGNATHASLYMAFYDGGTPLNKTDGEIGFRLRVAADKNPAGFESVFWVGIDANNDGKIDLFAGAISGNAASARVGLFPAGNDLNISPSTTSVDAGSPYFSELWTASNYNHQPVTTTSDPTATNTNLDNGTGGGGSNEDHFVSFKLPLIHLVDTINSLALPGIGSFNEDSVFQIIAATSNNANALNQDLNGVSGGTTSISTWEDLGGFSPKISTAGGVIPEPSTSLLLMACALLYTGLSRNRTRR